MIIAYYPGAGGNRYLQRVLGNSWDQFNISYDDKNRNQLLLHRYLLDTVSPTLLEHTLTHCVNSRRIAEVFPGQDIMFIKSDLQASLRREWLLHGHKRFVDRQIKKDVSRLCHYEAIKDPAWPKIDSVEQLDQLPTLILSEVQADYAKVTDQNIDVPGVLESITQDCLDKINSAYEIISWHKDYYNNWPMDFSQAAHILDLDQAQDDFCVFMTQELDFYHSDIFDMVWKAVYNEQR
jgi:hypothetical protein